jgi:hypothetical protein
MSSLAEVRKAVSERKCKHVKMKMRGGKMKKGGRWDVAVC